MTMEPRPERPVYSLGLRKVIVFALATPLIAVLVVMLLDYKGFISCADYGVKEEHLYLGGLGLMLVTMIPIVITWRCPGCKTYLGRGTTPTHCPSCGAEFR